MAAWLSNAIITEVDRDDSSTSWRASDTPSGSPSNNTTVIVARGVLKDIPRLEWSRQLIYCFRIQVRQRGVVSPRYYCKWSEQRRPCPQRCRKWTLSACLGIVKLGCSLDIAKLKFEVAEKVEAWEGESGWLSLIHHSAWITAFTPWIHRSAALDSIHSRLLRLGSR